MLLIMNYPGPLETLEWNCTSPWSSSHFHIDSVLANAEFCFAGVPFSPLKGSLTAFSSLSLFWCNNAHYTWLCRSLAAGSSLSFTLLIAIEVWNFWDLDVLFPVIPSCGSVPRSSFRRISSTSTLPVPPHFHGTGWILRSTIKVFFDSLSTSTCRWIGSILWVFPKNFIEK